MPKGRFTDEKKEPLSVKTKALSFLEGVDTLDATFNYLLYKLIEN